MTSILDFYNINDIWITTNCQQQPLFWGPKDGFYTGLTACICKTYGYNTDLKKIILVEIYQIWLKMVVVDKL